MSCAFGGIWGIWGIWSKAAFFDYLQSLVGIGMADPFNLGILAVVAFITGLISIVRNKERSIAVYLVVAFGSWFTINLLIFLLQNY